jgi:hypothetical protein
MLSGSKIRSLSVPVKSDGAHIIWQAKKPRLASIAFEASLCARIYIE